MGSLKFQSQNDSLYLQGSLATGLSIADSTKGMVMSFQSCSKSWFIRLHNTLPCRIGLPTSILTRGWCSLLRTFVPLPSYLCNSCYWSILAFASNVLFHIRSRFRLSSAWLSITAKSPHQALAAPAPYVEQFLHL